MTLRCARQWLDLHRQLNAPAGGIPCHDRMRTCAPGAKKLAGSIAQVVQQRGERHAPPGARIPPHRVPARPTDVSRIRSEEHTSELQSRENLVCRLLLEKKKI